MNNSKETLNFNSIINAKYEEFKNPSNEYRGKPFWSWNGKLNKEELLRQVDNIKDMGMGGFFMHSRIGLVTEYLGDEWFDLINACTDKAEKIGLEAWLYDEDRWPSGTAGGMVTKKKENRMKFILMHINDEIIDHENVLCCFECDLDGVNYTNKNKIDSHDYTNKSKIWFEIVEHPKDTFYNGHTYADTLKRETTQDFIKLTHEKYVENCGNRIGNTIKGIFTDEPHRGYLMCNAMFNGHAVPYTEELPNKFKEQWGYDIIDCLPELFLRENGEKVSQVKWHYVELLQQMFLENFAKPVYDWCKKYNMILTGHGFHEDSLSAQTIAHGSIMRFYEYMDYPGVDVLTEKNTAYSIVKQLSSSANQLNKRWCLSELYGCTGWQMNFESHKNVGDWQALMGVNVRCHHLSWYTMEGECKRDYPASIFHQSSWYKEYKYVEDYFSRLGVFLDQGNCMRDCLVINPIESIWCRVYAGWAGWPCAIDEDVILIEEHYKKLYNYLLECNVNFDFADEEMMSRLYHINGNEISIGKIKYKKVVISGLTTVRSTTLKILNEFIENGGEVIVLGDLPQYIDAIKSDIIIAANVLEFTKDNIMKLKNNIISAEADKIFIEIKSDGDNIYIMMLNSDRENLIKTKVSINVEGAIEQWCARTGNRFLVDNIDELLFEAGEEKLFVITKSKEKIPRKINDYDYIEIGLSEKFNFEIDEPNICVIDTAKCTVNEKTLDEKDVLKIDMALRQMFNQSCRNGFMLQPWFVDKNNIQVLAKIKLDYEFNIDVDPMDIELVVENAEGLNIKVNGNEINTVSGKWIDICFDKLPISKEILRKGSNIITIEMEFTETSNIEAIYILGDFGVKIDKTNLTLTNFPKNIGLGDIKNYGFPFYSGKITYKYETDMNGEGIVILKDMCGAACVKVNGEMIAFRPYQVNVENVKNIEIELFLTRRNTFGPLHVPNDDISWYGPDTFITYGDDYTEEYNIFKNGLNQVPKILVPRNNYNS